MSYMTISSQEKHNFSLCSCFHTHPTTLLLTILGGPMHGRPPHPKFSGAKPPLGPRPCLIHLIIPPPNLYDTYHNSYSVASDPLEIGSELSMDYPLDNPFDSSQRS